MANLQSSISKIRIAFVSGGVVWAALLTYVVHSFSFGWYIALTDGAVCTLLLGAACWLINNNLRYYQPGKGSYINLFFWCLALTAACTFGSRWVLPYIINNTIYTNFLVQSITI
ncbi:MAG: hypothetical protein ACXVI9_09690, partial [Mucilaginibacter sp.]